MPLMAKSLTKAKEVVWAFPQAPVGAMGATAWWHIDLMKWMASYSQGGEALAKMIREEPSGLSECRRKLHTLIDELLLMVRYPTQLVCDVTWHGVAQVGGLDVSRLVLAGFSQGSITARHPPRTIHRSTFVPPRWAGLTCRALCLRGSVRVASPRWTLR